MYGVSPAYFYSSFGPGFRPSDIESALPGLRDLGYESFQAEAFQAEIAESWTGNDSARLSAKARDLGLSVGAFVAHWLGAEFSSPEALGRPGSTPGTHRALEIAAALGGAPVFAVPLPALALPGGGYGVAETGAAALEASRTRLRNPLIEKLSLLAEAARRAGFRLALELLPGNALGGSSEFLSLLSIRGLSGLGLVLDTGHFHVMGEDLPGLPGHLAGAIAATHLCDNDGIENLSLAPGAGAIPFRPLLSALAESGYSGGLDVEIVCPAGEVSREYGRALAALRAMEPLGPARDGSDAGTGEGRNCMNARGPEARSLERSPV